MSRPQPTGLLVVGMHRSGTSALAGVLGKLGIPLGERLLEPGSDNPKGYWEHCDIVAVHERLLSALGSRWDDIRALPDGWTSSEAADRARAAIGEILSRDFGAEPVWAVKDPRVCRFLPLWLEVLDHMKIRPALLFIVRDPSEVAASIAARNHWASPLGEILWLRYLSDAAIASAHARREIIMFDDLLADPVGVASQALAHLDVPMPCQPTESMLGKIRVFVDSADRHQHRDASSPVSGFATVAHRMYVALKRIAHGEAGWDRLEKSIGDFRSRSGREPAVAAVAGMAMRFASDAQTNAMDRDVCASRLHAQLAWSDQAVKRHEALQAANADLASKLNAQLAWSDQAVKQREALQAESADLSSKLTAQVAWAEDWVKKHEALQTANADLASKLNAQLAWSDGAVKEHEAVRANAARLSTEVALQARLAEDVRTQRDALSARANELAAKLREAETQNGRAHDDLARIEQRWQVERDRMVSELADMRRRLTSVEIERDAVYASTSWKFTKPLRALARALKSGAVAPKKGDKEHQ